MLQDFENPSQFRRIIFEEANYRENDIKKEIQNLYNLFKYNYSTGKKSKRVSMIYNAIGYLTNNIDFNVPLKVNIPLFIKIQCNCNKLFMNKTIITEPQTPIKIDPIKNIKNIESEKCNDKLNYFNHLTF